MDGLDVGVAAVAVVAVVAVVAESGAVVAAVAESVGAAFVVVVAKVSGFFLEPLITTAKMTMSSTAAATNQVHHCL